jgi:signal peptidase
MRRLLRWAINGLGLLVAAAAVAIVAGGLLHRPMLLGLVPSGSMVPALERGDLAVIVPIELVPAVGVGGVIVFHSKEAPWVVHRIVGGDAESGYVTKGDANADPDRGRTLPADVVGVVPVWGDGLARLPGVGRLVPALAILRQPVVMGGLVVVALALVVWPRRDPAAALRARRRKVAMPGSSDHLALYFGLAAAVWVAITLQSVITSAPIEGRYTVVESSKDGLTRGEVLAGTTRTETLRLNNPFPLPVAGVFSPQSPGVAAEPDRVLVPPRSTLEAKLSISGERGPGEYPLSLRRSFYLPVLPLSWLAALTGVSPLLAAAAVGLVPACAMLLVGALDARVQFALRLWLLRAWLRVPRYGN